MRITLALMVVFITFGCTPAPIQTPTPSNKKAEGTEPPSTDLLNLHSTERAATVFALQTASTTPFPARRPTETLTPIPTLTPLPRLLSPHGPWLLYLRNIPRPAMADIPEVPPEFVLLNQNGSGRTSIQLPCSRDINAFLMDKTTSVNYIASYASGLFLFRPSEATGIVVRGLDWGYPACRNNFYGNQNGGLLYTFYQATRDVSPELILYELPSGQIRERFPLVRCSKDTDICEKFRSNWQEMMGQKARWSPNGRYLAFVAILDASSSDLFVYDTEDGTLRRLTNGPDWVGPIEWSPDGTRIIMQEILNDGDFLFDPYSKAPSSVWSISVSTNESKFLYSTGDAYTIQNILRWTDDTHFIAYQGFLINADQALDLRLVDVNAGTDRILFNGVFVTVSFDPIHQVLALYEQNTENCLPSRICLVSINDGTIRSLKDLPENMYFPYWDEKTGLFVSNSDCKDDTQSWQAVTYQGTFVCTPKPKPTSTPVPIQTVSHPAPNGNWSISVNNGLWLATDTQPAILVSQDTVSDVIWCLDSSCFFYSVMQQDHHWNLYRVSVPDLTIKLVDEGIEFNYSYKWLEVE